MRALCASVNLRTPLHKLLLALGVLAIVSAQVFGVDRSFLCLCTGTLVATASDHCHGPHGKNCHEKEEPAHSGESCPDGGDKQPHAQVAQDFQSLSAPAAPFVLPAPELLVLLTLDDSRWGKAEPVPALENAADLRGSPPTSVAVARTIVLRI